MHIAAKDSIMKQCFHGDPAGFGGHNVGQRQGQGQGDVEGLPAGQRPRISRRLAVETVDDAQPEPAPARGLLLIINADEGVAPEEEGENLDGLNYLAGKTLHQVNEKAFLGVKKAHLQGGVPQLAIHLVSIPCSFFETINAAFIVPCKIFTLLTNASLPCTTTISPLFGRPFLSSVYISSSYFKQHMSLLLQLLQLPQEGA